MKKALRLSALAFVCIFVLIALSALVSCTQDPMASIKKTPTIRGSVTIPSGANVKGSDFYIRIMEGENAVYTGKVKDDGSFAVEGLDETKTYSILLSTEELGEINTSSREVDVSRDIARATTTSGYGGWLKNVTASVNEQAGVGSIKVKPLGTIKGVAKRSGEEEHSDIMVYIPGTSYMAVTDANGNYSIFNVPQSSSTYNLRCISLTGDWLPEVITGVLLYSDSDTENPVKTVPERSIVKNAGNLLGTIIKTAATDNSNITVLIQNDEFSETGTTAADGSLRITGILPGTYKVTISSTGFVTQTIDNVIIRAAKDTSFSERVLVANGGDIIGTISTNDGSSNTGAIITATSQDKKYVYTTQTSTDGSFVIPNAFATTYDIIVTKTGYADTIKNNVRVSAGQIVALGTIELSSSYGTISGRVLDNKGNAIENAIIKVGETSILTNEEGSFSKSGILVGNYSVTVSKEGFSTYSLSEVVTLESSNETRLGTIRLSSIYGSVSGIVTVNDGASAVDIDVSATSTEGESIQVKTTEGGSYYIPNLLPGLYTIKANCDGYLTAERIVSVTSDQNTLVDGLALKLSTGSLKVTVGYSDKDITSGITVTVTDNTGAKVAEAVTTNNLTIIFNSIPIGSFNVTAEAEGYAASVRTGVAVMSALETSVSMPALASNYGTVSGLITDTKGNALESAIVKIGEISVFTAADGKFLKTGIPVGNHIVSVSKEGYSTQTLAEAITIESSSTTNIGSIQLASIYGSVSGFITVNDGKSVANIDVNAIDSEGAKIQSKTKEDGSYSIQGLTPGQFTVTANADDYSGASRSVSVSADRNTEVDVLALNSIYGTITGRVVDSEGNPLSGVSIMIGNLDVVTTKTDGTFIKELVPIGQYSLSVTKDGFVDEFIEDIEIQSYIITQLTGDIVLTPKTGLIIGRVRVEGESDFSGIKVTVSSNGNGKEYSAYTDSDGLFSISAVAGNYNQVGFSHSCCFAQYYLDNVALFANGSVEIKPQGSNSSEYQLIFNHNYGMLYNESQASTCTEQGFNKLRCWGCGKEITEYLELLNHDTSMIDHLDPTCTEDGWRKYECASCGQVFTEVDSSLGHDWDKPVLIEASTCHSAGSQKLTCKTCGAEEIQTIEKLPHTWVDNGYHNGKIEYICSICDETVLADDSTSILNISDWGSVSLKPSVDPNSVKTLIIPSEIDGMTVTSVFNHTFQDCVNITKIVLPNTLTTIEDWAFAGCIGVTEIELPASLERIGEHAFRGCTSLKSIEIPAGLNEINHYAFYGCSSLASVTLPETITMLGRECFAGCSFDRIHIPDSVENIVCYAFCDNTNLKEVLIPRSVKYMDDRPFMGCWNLETVYIQSETQPSGWVSTWNDTSARIVWGYTGDLHYAHTESTEWNISSTYHWHECTECGEVLSMSKHEYTDAVTKQPTCTEAGIRTYTCTVCGQSYTEEVPALGHDYHSEVTVQATCTEKGELTYTCSCCDSTFTEEIVSHHEYDEVITTPATCTTDGLKTLTCSVCGDSKTEVIPATGHTYKETVIPATCTEPGTRIYKCEKCDDTYEEEILATGHNYVASITKQATCEEDGIKTFTCSRCSDSYTETINAYGHYFATPTIVQPATCYEAGVKSSKCFRCGKTVTEEIPATGHTEVHKNDDIYHWTECKDCGLIFREKEEHIFVSTVCTGCGFCSDELYFTVGDDGSIRPKDVSILPETLVIPSVVNGKKVTKVAADSFRDCPYVKHLIISEGIEALDYAAFMGSSLLTTVSLPATISRMEYGGSQFGWCDNLDSIVFSGTMEQWKRIDFGDTGHIAHNNNIARIICSDGIIDYSDYFANADGCFFIKDRQSFFESEFTVPSEIDGISITGISGDCFSDCSTLESITIPEGVTHFLWRCFSNCINLREVNLPDSLSSLGSDTFANCISLKTISLPKSLTMISERAFQNCTGIQSITLPSTIDAIPEGLFDGATKLTEIIFEGTVSQWNALSKGAGWCKGVPATKVVCSDGEVEFKSLYVVGKTLYSDKSELLPSDLEIPSNLDGNEVTILSGHLFDNDYHFTSIIIPEGITTIYSAAFRDCQNVTSITLPSTITSIGDDVFCRCKKIEEITIPSGIKIIERAAFYDCDLLSYVSLPDLLRDISNDAFAYCERLESITIPNKVNRLGGSAFAGSGLLSIDIPNSVTTLEGGVFQFCSSLESVVISGNITEIPGDLFRGDSSLTSIMFNGTVAKWNSLNKGSGWNEGVPATKVVCIDGEVNL